MPPMKFGSFSDAILYGAKLRPQGVWSLFPGELSCAIGAGVEAIFEANDPRYGKGIISLFPYLANSVHECPQAGCQIFRYAKLNVIQMLAHLNDVHRWAREEVAQWLRDEVEDKLGYVTISDSEVEFTSAGPSDLRVGENLSPAVSWKG